MKTLPSLFGKFIAFAVLMATCATASAGTMLAFGENGTGQLGLGYSGTVTSPATSSEMVRAMSVGNSHALFVLSDGTLHTVGSNSSGQLGVGTGATSTPRLVEGYTVVAVSAASSSHSLFLTSAGQLYAMGDNRYGQLGDGTTENRATPVLIANNVKAISAGNWHSLYLTADGALYAMGRNDYGQLGDGTTTDRLTPVQVASGVKAISAGGQFSLFLKADGTLHAMGINSYGQLGDGTTTSHSTPVQVASGVVSMSAGLDHSMYINSRGTVYAMGNNTYGQLGDGTTTDTSTPIEVAFGVKKVSCGWYHSLILRTWGEVASVGRNHNGQLGIGSTIDSTAWNTVASQVSDICAGGNSNLILKADSTRLYAAGLNSTGQLGDATNASKASPVEIATDVIDASAGHGMHSMFLTSGGILRTMGWNQYGQLGNDTNVDANAPVEVAMDVAKISAGGSHSLFISAFGDLMGFGLNTNGQLGNGNNDNQWTATSVAPDVIEVSGGGIHTLFLTVSGELFAMGDNAHGQLGNGTNTDSNTPVLVAGNVIALSAGGSHSLYITADGTLYAMGDNSHGQLGNGNTTSTNTPVAIRTNMVECYAGYDFSMARDVEGNLYVFGYNEQGQLGLGTTTDVLSPTQVASATLSTTGGYAHTLLLSGNGSLSASGDNSEGQFGNGTTTGSNVLVPTGTSVLKADAGYGHTLILKDPGSPAVVTQNPFAETIAEGADYTMSVQYTSLSSASIQWYRDTTPIPDAVGTQLPLSNVSATDEGFYYATITNAAGTVRSGMTFLRVTPASGGEMYATGMNGNGQLCDSQTVGRDEFAYSIGDVVKVAAGDGFTCYLNESGELYGVGDNTYGQLGNNTTTASTAPLLIASNVVDVQAGIGHVLFLANTGELSAIGLNTSGQLGNGTSIDVHTPMVVAYNVARISAGDTHSLYISKDGTLFGTGRSLQGQLGTGSSETLYTFAQIAEGVVNASAGTTHSLYVTAEGKLMAMGGNASGQLGNGTTDNSLTAVQIASGVANVSAGGSHSLFVTQAGVMMGMGANSKGQLGDGTTQDRLSPVEIRTGIKSVEAGTEHSFFISTTEDSLYATGDNIEGQLGNGTTSGVITPVIIATDVKAVSANMYSSFYIENPPPPPTIYSAPSGGVYDEGDSISLTVQFTSEAELLIQWFHDSNPVDGGNTTTLNLSSMTNATHSGYYWVTGTNSSGSVTTTPVYIAVNEADPGIMTGRRLMGLGDNFNGQFGNGSFGYINTPIQMQTGVVDCAASRGIYSNLQAYIDDSGRLWVMGLEFLQNENTVIDASKFVPAQLDTDVRKVVVGYNHILYIKTDDTLWGIGSNVYGQLGNAAAAWASTPVQIDSGVSQCSAGMYFSIYLKSGGVYTMGTNTYGQLGDGTTTARSVPTLIANNAIMVGAGGWHTVFLLSDGSLMGAGGGWTGALQTSSVVGYNNIQSTPVQIASDVAWAGASYDSTEYVTSGGTLHRIATATDTTIDTGVSTATSSSNAEGCMYLKTDGTLWVIGSNSNGILGAGEQVNVAVPFQIDSDVTSACLGTSTCLYVKDDHTLRASGIREYLALSEPPVNYSTPVMIANDVLDVAAGQFGGHIAYLADSTVVYTVGDNTYGQLASGQVFPSATPVFAAMGGASVFAGENNSFYLAQNGDLFGCGYNGSYILNDGTNTNRSSMQRIALNVSTMANCFSSLLFIDQSGQLYGIGNNLSGKLGDGTTVDKTIPTSIASNVAKVAISEQHSAYITTGKALFTMGNNGYGQLGDGTDTTRLSPVQVATGVSSVAAGNTFTVFVEEETGLLYYTGMFLGHGGMHGMGGYEMSQTPVAILPYVKEVFATGGGVLFLTSDGALYGMGSNYSGQLGGTEENYYTPVRIATHVTKAAGSSSFTVYVQEVYGHLPEVLTQPTGGTYVDGDSVSLSVGTSNAESIQWYHDAQSVAGTGSNTLDLGEVDENDEGFYWASVTNGSGSAYSDMVYVRVNRSGTNPGYYLLGAGSNENGQIGFETENGILVTPTIVDTNVVSVTSGTNHTGYISSSGDLYVMGYNTSGQLGVAGENIIYDPILLAQNVAKVAVGEAHTMYLTTSGTLYVLGRNVEGQLGLGEDTLNRYAPVLLAEGVVDIAAGNFSSYYVTRDGLLYAFGANAMGQLGDGTTTTRRTPVQIASDVIKVASQVDHALYLTSSKVLFGMGRNANYQLGDGTTENKTTPIQIATNVVSMSTGAMDSVYLTSTGVLMGMGRNLHGELGDGTNNPRAFDFEISTGISKASLGTYHLMAISTSGELLGTGQNSSGQLMTGEGSQPVMVLTHSMDDIVDVVGSYDRTFVLSETSNSLPQIVTPPEGGTWTVGDDVELTVTVQSETPVTYQWYTEAGAIENADENTLRIDNVTLNDAGYYWVVVTNDTGSITVPSVQVVVELPIVSAFEPVRELGWKWSLLGWTHDGSFPWVYSWNFDAWFYVYGGLSADVETGFWTYYANSSGTHNGYGYMTPGYWWAYEYRTGAWCAYFEYPLPPDAPEGFEIVQSGSYQMGSPDSEANRDERETLHNVTLTYEFAIQQREVTWQQWTNVRTWALQHGYSDIPAARNGKDGDSSGQHPVTMVNWYDCVKWLNAWSEMEGLEPCYRTSGSVYRSGTPDSITCDWSATGFRLPTEAEWEYACRAGTTGAFNNGAASPEAVAWYSANSGANTHAVGTRAANAWGLYDMHGNVWEWCWDWYGALASTSVSDPTGAATGTSRIIRGGSWYNDAKYCRSAFRYSNYSPFNRYDNVGFRAVIVPEN